MAQVSVTSPTGFSCGPQEWETSLPAAVVGCWYAQPGLMVVMLYIDTGADDVHFHLPCSLALTFVFLLRWYLPRELRTMLSWVFLR